MDIRQMRLRLLARVGIVIIALWVILAILSWAREFSAAYAWSERVVAVPFAPPANWANIDSSPITFGEAIAASIDSPGEEDAYTFEGEVGDKILVRMNDTPSTGFGSEIHIYRPGGSLLCSGFDANGNLAEIHCTLDADGTFTVLAMDHFGTTTGAYTLYVQRTNEPGQASPLSLGGTVSATLSLPTEMKTYTFTGSSADVIFLRMNDTPNTGFGSEIRLYRPDGTLLCTGWDVNGGLAEQSCALDADGVYTIVAGDRYAWTSGEFSLFAQSVTAPRNALAISFGATITDSIALPVHANSYQFTGNISDTILMRMMDIPNTGFGSQTRVYRPDGSLLCSAWDSFGGLAQLNCVLDVNGPFTLLAMDRRGSATGIYGMHLQRINRPGNSMSIKKNASLLGEITVPTGVDAYEVRGSNGDVLQIKMDDVPSSGFASEIRLYRPDGSLVCSGWHTSGYQAVATCHLDLDTSYILLAMDRGGRYVSQYTLDLICDGCKVDDYFISLPLIRLP